MYCTKYHKNIKRKRILYKYDDSMKECDNQLVSPQMYLP